MTPATSSDLANNPSGMQIFKRRYFNINRRYLMCLGLWPYEVKTKKYVLRTIAIFLVTLCNLCQLTSMYLHHDNIDRFMLSTICFSLTLLMNLKMLTMILAEKNMKLLYRNIANNWQQIEDYCERDVLHKYSERARNATIFFVALTIPSAFLIATMPLIPKILDSIWPLENPRPNIDVLGSELILDRETYFPLYFLLDFFEIMLIGFVAVTVDTMYIATVEHCCALYAIIRFRLLELRPTLQRGSSGTEDVDSYEWLRPIIQIHQTALTFCSLLNDSYSRLFLFKCIVALFMFPFASCAIIANLDNPLLVIPYALFLVNAAVHGFVVAYPGQRIIDHQISLLDAAYCNEWYTVPFRTRKLLCIFMMRCSQPVMITAGGFVPVNLEMYFKVMKASASYITVASSFR